MWQKSEEKCLTCVHAAAKLHIWTSCLFFILLFEGDMTIQVVFCDNWITGMITTVSQSHRPDQNRRLPLHDRIHPHQSQRKCSAKLIKVRHWVTENDLMIMLIFQSWLIKSFLSCQSNYCFKPHKYENIKFFLNILALTMYNLFSR